MTFIKATDVYQGHRLTRVGFAGARTNHNGNLEERRPQITVTDKTIVRTFERLGESAKRDTETRREPMGLGKRCRQTCSVWGRHDPSIGKNHSICKAQQGTER